MIETVWHLKHAGVQAPVCIGVHAIFADNAFKELNDAGTASIITSNTIEHESNGIDVSGIVGKRIFRTVEELDACPPNSSLNP